MIQKLKRNTRNLILILFILVIPIFIFCGCDNSQNQGNGSSTSNNSSNLGNYNIVIESARTSIDYDDNPIIIIKYKFTNNSSSAISFILAVDDEVYQNGIGLNECYVADNSAHYSSDNHTKNVQPGHSLYVEVAYELNDTHTNVTVEVSQYMSFSNKKVTKTFTL